MQFISSLDVRVLETLYAYRDLTAVDIFIGVSELASALFIGGLIFCIGIILILRGRYAYLLGLVVSSLGGAGSMFLLKELIERIRPPVMYQAYIENGFSLPSGHATIAAAFYGFCIYLLWRLVPSLIWRTMAILGLGTLIAGIAFSRLYLGGHYLSDVIAGLILGGIFVWIGIAVVRRLEIGESP